jgi:hypothetical protein
VASTYKGLCLKQFVARAAWNGIALRTKPGRALSSIFGQREQSGLRILGVEQGLPPLPDLEFAICEKARPHKAATALAAVLLTLAQRPSRPVPLPRDFWGCSIFRFLQQNRRKAVVRC